MDGNGARLDWGGSASSGPRRILRGAFSRTPALRVLTVVAILVFVLGAVYTAAGQDNPGVGSTLRHHLSIRTITSSCRRTWSLLHQHERSQ